MRRRVMLTKLIGETPLAALKRWRSRHPTYRETAACYAGRLDPMASGKLLILLGDECKRQQYYHALDKEYEVEILLDIASDTGDILGMSSFTGNETHPTATTLRTAFAELVGSHEVAYPVFSSKTVRGKPLFLYALEHTLDSIEVPTHIETIYRIQLQKVQAVDTGTLRTRIMSLLALAPTTHEPSKALGANFRIKEVTTSWERLWERSGSRRFTILKLRVRCASGAYMRTLAKRVGDSLQTRALALSIRRTRIGGRLALRFWW